jgi:Uma2 family endonuclease
MSAILTKHCFSVNEYHMMADSGIFSEEDRVELIDGEIIDMSPIGSRHAACVARLTDIFSQAIVSKASVWVQNPVLINEISEPVPDVTLVKRRHDFYAEGHPTPSDILLIVEVSDSTLAYDRSIKLPLYARAGIVEVWIFNLQKDAIEAHREPVNGMYQQVKVYRRGEELTIQMLEGISFKAEDLLG